MRIARFQWPEDLTEAELRESANLEREIVIFARRFNESESGRREFASRVAERLDDFTPPALRGRLRAVTGELEPFVDHTAIRRMGLRVRLTWTMSELNRRQADRRAREERNRLEALAEERRRARVAPRGARYEVRAMRTEPPPAAASAPFRGVLRNWNFYHHADRSWCEVELEDLAGTRRTVELAAGEDRPAEGVLYDIGADGRARKSIQATEAARSSGGADLDLLSARVRELDRAIAMGLERQAEELFAESTRAVMPDTATGRDLARLAGLAGLELDVARVREQFGLRSPLEGLTGEHAALIQMIASQTAHTFADVLEGYVVRVRDSGPLHVRARDGAALADAIATRQAGDRWYVVKGPPPISASSLPALFTPNLPPQLKRPELGAYRFAYGAAEVAAIDRRLEREREAVDLVLRIALAVALAHDRATHLAAVFYAFARACLEPWAKNPTPIELDIDRAPVPVDMGPEVDDAAARFALLELER